jgi:Ca-activated chloride channel family protein
MLRFPRPRRLPRAWPLFLSIAVTLVASLAVASRATAQEPIRNASELVKLDVGVLDRDGHFAGGLERSDFRVWDNGVEKPVQFFSPIDSPERVLILVETGPAVYLIHEQHLQALSALLEGLGPSDEAALVTYDDSPRRVLDFTANKQALLDAISDAQFRIGTGDLNFYDSVSKVLDSLSDSVGKKAIVVLTTGLDSSPPSRWDALENRLRRDDVVIYSVGLGGSLRDSAPAQPKSKKPKHGAKAPPPQSPSVGESAFARATTALLSIARITGGRTYFPQTQADYAPTYAEIAAALRHEYVLGISPDHDGQYHSLTVQVVGRGQPPKSGDKTPDFRPFCREGYLAPTP